MSKVFRLEHDILFSICDPAGIAYYPRLFDLQHQTMENWFNDGLGIDYADLLMKQRLGAPTVSIRADFTGAAHFGDRLAIELAVTRIGKSSVDLEYTASNAGKPSFKVFQTICLFSLDTRKAVPIPDDMRARMEAFLAAAA